MMTALREFGSARRRGLTAVCTMAVAVVCLSAGLSGCRGDRSNKPPRQFLPDMDDQPRWSPQSASDFFADGRTMRKPVSGTVAYGRRVFEPEIDPASWTPEYSQQRRDLLAEDPGFYFGVTEGVDPRTAWQVDDPEAFIDRIPIELDMQTLARGRNRFDIYCAACHGYQGEGGGVIDGQPYGGMVGRRWSYTVPGFHEDKYKDPDVREGRDGYLFYTALYGVEDGARMPGYAHALSPTDAWAIVAYIRALQMAREGELADAPPQQREILQRQRSAAGAGNGGGS